MRKNLFTLAAAAVALLMLGGDASACGRAQVRREARQAARQGCSGGQPQTVAFRAPAAPAAPAPAVTAGGCAGGSCPAVRR